MVKALNSSTSTVPARFLSLLEADSKDLFAKYNVDCQRGFVTKSVDDVPAICEKLVAQQRTENFIVKAQILAGGRGKGTFDTGFQGGVKWAKDAETAQKYCEAMLGHRLRTAQTTAEGINVDRVYVAECLDIAREVYVAVVLDRGSRGPVVVGCKEGGVEIEKIAHERPDAILKLPIQVTGPQMVDVDAAKLAEFVQKLGFEGDRADKAANTIRRMAEMAAECDLTQLEVNPLVETKDGRVVVIDAKVSVDDSASARQKALFDLPQPPAIDEREAAAAACGLEFVGLDGSIGCLVNGAGLAMATMDIIKGKGGEPANFLDIGGTADAKRVAAAFRLITQDKNVKGILVNVFGGIVDCRTIAEGIILAVDEVKVSVPVVVRLSGTNCEAGLKRLMESGVDVKVASDLEEAAQQIVELTA